MLFLMLIFTVLLPMTYRIGGLAFNGYFWGLLIVLSIPWILKEVAGVRNVIYVAILYVVSLNVVMLLVTGEWNIFKYLPFYILPFFAFSIIKNQRINHLLLYRLVLMYLIICVIWSWYAYLFNVGRYLEYERVYRISGLFGEIAPFYARRINNIVITGVVLSAYYYRNSFRYSLVVLTLGGLALIPTGSRTNWFFFFMFVVGYLIVLKKYRYVVLLVIVSAILVSGFTFVKIRLGLGSDYVSSAGALGSLINRINIWHNFINERSDIFYFIFGQGTGKTKLELLQETSWHYARANALHNSILEHLYDIGFIGFSIIVVFYKRIISLISNTTVMQILVVFYLVFLLSCLTDPVMEITTNRLFISFLPALVIHKDHTIA